MRNHGTARAGRSRRGETEAPGTRFDHLVRRVVAPLQRCPVCREAIATAVGVCGACDVLIARAIAALPPPTGSIVSLGPYAGPWLRLVHALKFKGERRLAEYLGARLAQRCGAGHWRPNIVCHVPAAERRAAERGYDQADLIARAVARALRVEHTALLTRTGAAARQAHLGRAARALNASTAFRSRYAPGRSVLLIDDVMTTGATAEACAAALLAAGAQEVRTAVVARTVTGR